MLFDQWNSSGFQLLCPISCMDEDSIRSRRLITTAALLKFNGSLRVVRFIFRMNLLKRFHLVNGQLKQWKYFCQTIQNSSLRFLSNYLDITCALINAYTSWCIKHIHAGAEIAAQMLEKCKKPSPDQTRLIAMLEQNMQWSKYNAEALPFPTLTKEQVENFCYDKQNLPN